MKKLFIKTVTALLVMGGFKMVAVEPDRPHTFEVTIPAFTDIVEFFDTLGDEVKDLAKNIEVTQQNPSE